MENKLLNWLNDRMQQERISQRQLGKMAGISNTTISKVMSGDMPPSYDFCAAIANAFGERPEKVMRLAGLLPPSGGKLDDLSEAEAELVKLYRSLTDANDRETMFVVGQGLLMRQGQREGE